MLEQDAHFEQQYTHTECQVADATVKRERDGVDKLIQTVDVGQEAFEFRLRVGKPPCMAVQYSLTAWC